MKTRSRKRAVKSARQKAGAKKPRTKFLKDGSVKESFIQAEILSWLKTVPGIIFYRQNSGDIFLYGRKVTLGPLGAADICVIASPNGRSCGVEIKSKNGKPNPDQIAWAKKLTDVGGLYFIVRNLEQAKAAIAEILGNGTV